MLKNCPLLIYIEKHKTKEQTRGSVRTSCRCLQLLLPPRLSERLGWASRCSRSRPPASSTGCLSEVFGRVRFQGPNPARSSCIADLPCCFVFLKKTKTKLNRKILPTNSHKHLPNKEADGIQFTVQLSCGLQFVGCVCSDIFRLFKRIFTSS